jgi:proline racemase
MRSKRLLSVVDSHTEGQPERVIIGGVPPIPGATMIDKAKYVGQHMDDLRTLVLYEPRGHDAMHASILTAPVNPGSHAGVIYLSNGGYDTMCGHGTIAVSSVLVEMGLVPVQEPVTTVLLDTLAGQVRALVEVKDGSAKSSTIQNVPSFLVAADVAVTVPGVGPITLDIAYGGDCFYPFLTAESVGLEIRRDRVQEITTVGMKIWDYIQKEIPIHHPEQPDIQGFSGVIFTGPPTDPRATAKNTNSVPPGFVDRSPCGTGTCARMAVLHAKGQLALRQEFVHESIIGSLFYGKLIGETTVGPYKAVIPTVRGRAWIMSTQQFLLDPDDPFPAGFKLGREARYGPE